MAQVSVIVPTYNRSQVLAGALRSVLNQSFKDREIIVVDDGNDDNTAALVESLQTGAIRYFRHDRRRGSAACRNTGILHATGEYIAFLEDGHEWYPEKLMRQMQRMLASPARVGGVYTGCFIIDRATGDILDQFVPTARGSVREALLAGNCVGSASSMLMRRACVEEAGCFDERLPSFYDYDLWLRAARQYEFECLREPLLKQYVRGDEICANAGAFTRGLELMLQKYGQLPAFRRQCAAYYLGLGVQLCDAGHLHGGRKALLRAVRLHPWAAPSYLYLLLSLLGGDRLRRQTKTLFLPRLQSRAFGGGFVENV